MGLVRKFEPMVITTKEELLLALKTGDIKTSKYNLLTEDQKLFVELIVFGGYTAQEAIKMVRPKAKSFKALANRWTALPNVAETLEELSQSKDRKFMAEISNARDMALSKLQFIMSTTKDDSLAAVCAKTILDKAEKAVASKDSESNVVEGIKFAIELAKEVNSATNYNKDAVIIIPEDPVIDADVEDVVEEDRDLLEEVKGPSKSDKGLSYTLNYESVDNYTKV